MLTLNNICVLRLSAIGDVCHAIAMVQAIQRAQPLCNITWVIGKVEYNLVKHLPGIQFVVYDKKQGKVARQHVQRTLAKYVFDALLIMQVALRANWLSRVIKAKRRIGFDWHRSKEGHWCFCNERVYARQHAHVLEGFMDFADRLLQRDPTPIKASWNMHLASADLDWAADQLPCDTPYAVISPAASKAERNWTVEGYAAAADHLRARGIAPVLCGGPSDLDRQLADAIKQHTKNIQLDLVGQTSLTQMLAVLSRAVLVIAPDTGPAHMATTVGTPVIGLYAHSNPRRTGPYQSMNWVVNHYDQCILEQTGKPWDALPWGVRAKGQDLMQRIQAEEVIQKIDQLLQGD